MLHYSFAAISEFKKRGLFSLRWEDEEEAQGEVLLLLLSGRRNSRLSPGGTGVLAISWLISRLGFAGISRSFLLAGHQKPAPL